MTELIFWCYIFAPGICIPMWYLYHTFWKLEYLGLGDWKTREKSRPYNFLRLSILKWTFEISGVGALRGWGFENPNAISPHFLSGAQKVTSVLELHDTALPWWGNRNGSTWSLGREVLIQKITDFNGSQRQLVPDAGYHINLLPSLNSTPRCHPMEKVKDNSLITDFKIEIISKLQKLLSLLEKV